MLPPSASGSALHTQLPNASQVTLTTTQEGVPQSDHLHPEFELRQFRAGGEFDNYDNGFHTSALDAHTNPHHLNFPPTQQQYLSAGPPLLLDNNSSRERLINTNNMSYPPQRPDLSHQADTSYTHVPIPAGGGGVSGLPYDPERQLSQESTSSSAKLRKPGWGKKDAEQGYTELGNSRTGYIQNQSDAMLRLPDGEIPKTKVGSLSKNKSSAKLTTRRLESCILG